MAYFFLKLLPKRSDFPANMTDDERTVMQAHSAFLAEQLTSRSLVVAGPVLSATGAFGMAVFEADSLDAVRTIVAADPANAIGHYEIAPMASAIARP
jgi:uncharacterized protein